MNLLDKKPEISQSAFVADGARIIGDVRLCDDSSVWYNAVLRGDAGSITVGRRSNVQDNCTLHCDIDVPLVIGDDVTIGHNAVLHSCNVGDGSLIGMGAVILSGAVIGKGSIIAAGSVVTSGTVIPDGSLYMGIPAKFKCRLMPQVQAELFKNAKFYVELSAQYKQRTAGKCVPLNELDSSHVDMVLDLIKKCAENKPFYFKFDRTILENRTPGEINDFFYYVNEKPVGYLGLNSLFTAADETEISGMVLPEYSNSGIFSEMLNAALCECERRGIKKAFLTVNKSCSAGAIKDGEPERTILQMECKKSDWQMGDNMALTFRMATNRDLKELAFIDMMSLNIPREQAEKFYEKPSLCRYYIAQTDLKPVGKVGILYGDGGSTHIFGLAVSPLYQRRGFGREILDYAMDMIFSQGSETVLTEIEIENKQAQELFSSCGFKPVTEFDCFNISDKSPFVG